MTAPVVAYPTGVPDKDALALESAFDQAAKTGGTVVLARGATPFRVSRPIVVESPGRPFLSLDVQGERGYVSIPHVEYSGPPGTTFLTVRGLNSAHWQGLKVRLTGEGTTAFRLSTYGQWQSASMNTFERVNVETYAPGAVGWEVAPEGPGASDISGNRWVTCTVGGDRVHDQGLHAFMVGGGNTLGLVFDGCGGSFLTGHAFHFGADTRWDPQHGGGDASTIIAPLCSYCEGLAWVQCGFKLTVLGGRTEWASGPVFYTGHGRAVGRALVLNHRTGPECKTVSRADGATPVVLQ